MLKKMVIDHFNITIISIYDTDTICRGMKYQVRKRKSDMG
ncbi:hypothetical protein SORDD21_01402 [Streptococcus oralis]|uniref:Uncharacterized protein n=1 Tax=Streptococcus oralis TaxID=1303 RepID=A0A139PIN7_STROR|nr:hypothetical protein SORDD21_01402 [Streptococcus oralis]